MSGSRLGGVKTLEVAGFLDEFEKGDLKRSVDIVQLFSYFGVEAEKKGRSYMARCPWHEDSTPSLSIDRDKGLYNCFGCGESGDVFDLVKKMQGVEFKEALGFLKGFSGNNPGPLKVVKPEPVKTENKPSPTERFSREMNLKSVCEYYSKSLATNKAALDYLSSRGINDKPLLNRLGVGFSDGSLVGILSDAQKEELTVSGIITEKRAEAFKGCVTFPLFDEHGNSVGLYGRKISDKSKLKHLYIKGPHLGVFNREAVSAYPENIIITESIIDSLSLLQMGIKNTTALFGTNGLTDELLELLKSSRVKMITLALDNDDAGLAATEKLKQRFLDEGFAVKTITPPECKDWNEYLSLGSSGEGVEKLVSAASVEFPPEDESGFLVQKEGPHYVIITPKVTYKVIGVKDNIGTSLKVNMRAEASGLRHIDNVDLFSARSRNAFSSAVCRTFDLESARVGTDLLRLLDYLEAEKEREVTEEGLKQPELTDEEQTAGFELLRDPKLFDRVITDTEALGYVGEELNKLLIYIAASSRKLADPISVMVVSQSASGKSYLIDTIKKLIPPEDVVSLTSLSEQALNYLPEGGLLNKFLVMGEAVHSEVVEHQVREMLSAGELSRLVTVKDQKTGKMVSRSVRTKTVVSAVMSSTKLDMNHENLSRFFVVNADESAEQTRRIHEAQRRKYSLERYRQKEVAVPGILKVHQAAQRLLTRRIIVNPFADYLAFPDNLMRSRRDHERFIDLIACVCHLRQYQKEEKQADGLTFIECDIEDYKIAYRIMCGILPMTLSNVPHTAVALYEQVRGIAKKKAVEQKVRPEDIRLTQREIREQSSIGQRTIKKYMKLLVDYEYLRVTGLGVRGSRNSYSLMKDEDLNLVDLSSLPAPEAIEKQIEKVKSGASGEKRGIPHF